MINIHEIPLTGTYKDIEVLRDAYIELATELSGVLSALENKIAAEDKKIINLPSGTIESSVHSGKKEISINAEVLRLNGSEVYIEGETVDINSDETGITGEVYINGSKYTEG